MAILVYANFKKLFDKTRIEQLASAPTNGGEEYDKTIVEAIIAQADGFVYNALCNMYSTTEMDADAVLPRLCGALAMYYLELRRNQISEVVEREYKSALKMLDDLREGKTRLVDVAQLLPKGETQQKSYVSEGDYFRGIEDVEVT